MRPRHHFVYRISAYHRLHHLSPSADTDVNILGTSLFDLVPLYSVKFRESLEERVKTVEIPPVLPSGESSSRKTEADPEHILRKVSEHETRIGGNDLEDAETVFAFSATFARQWRCEHHGINILRNLHDQSIPENPITFWVHGFPSRIDVVSSAADSHLTVGVFKPAQRRPDTEFENRMRPIPSQVLCPLTSTVLGSPCGFLVRIPGEVHCVLSLTSRRLTTRAMKSRQESADIISSMMGT